MYIYWFFCCFYGAVRCGGAIIGYNLKEIWVCGRLHFPTIVTPVSPIPHALLHCDCATSPSWIWQVLWLPWQKNENKQTPMPTTTKPAEVIPYWFQIWLGNFHFCLLQDSHHIRGVTAIYPCWCFMDQNQTKTFKFFWNSWSTKVGRGRSGVVLYH